MHWRISQDGLFGLNEANVACRQLGFPLGAIEPVKGYHPYPMSYISGRSTLISNVETRLSCRTARTGTAECCFGGADSILGSKSDAQVKRIFK